MILEVATVMSSFYKGKSRTGMPFFLTLEHKKIPFFLVSYFLVSIYVYEKSIKNGKDFKHIFVVDFRMAKFAMVNAPNLNVYFVIFFKLSLFIYLFNLRLRVNVYFRYNQSY